MPKEGLSLLKNCFFFSDAVRHMLMCSENNMAMIDNDNGKFGIARC